MSRRRLRGIVRAESGPLTDELTRTPGGFGLGQVPADRAPRRRDDPGVRVLLDGLLARRAPAGGDAVNLTPSRDWPVNRGLGLPQGVGGAGPAERSRSGHFAHGAVSGVGHCSPVDWPEALALFTERFQAIQAEHGPDSVAFLSTGQIPTEEMALLGAVAKFGMGMVHGDGNTRQCMATSVAAHKEAFGFDAPAVHLRRPGGLRRHRPGRVEPVHRPPDPVGAHRPQPPPARDHRGRPAGDRDGGMAATQHYAARPKSDLTLLYGLAHLLIERGAVDRPFIAEHTTGFEAFAAHVAAFDPERVAADTGLSVEQLERFAATIAGGERVSFWWTMGVNQSHQGGAHGAGHHRPGPADRQHRAARHRGQLDHRAVQRHGVAPVQQHHQPVRRSGLHRCRPPGRGGRPARHRRRPPSPIAPAWPTTRSSRASTAAPSAACGSWPPTRPTPGSTRPRSASCWAGSTILVVQDLYATTETAQLADLVLPAAGWGEKDGHLHQLGAAHRARPAACVGHRGRRCTDFAIVKAAWPRPGAAASCSPTGTRPRRCSPSWPGCRPAGRATSPGSRAMRISTTAGVQWPYPAGAAEAPSADATAECGRRTAAVRRRPVLHPGRSGPLRGGRAGARAWSDRRDGSRCRCSPVGAPRPSGTPVPAPRSPRSCAAWPPTWPTWRSPRPTPSPSASGLATRSWSSRPGVRCRPGRW